MTIPLRIGILAFQGAFAEHQYSLSKAFKENQTSSILKDYVLELVEVKKPQHLDGLFGLILPGGESTTMGKFLERNKFKDVLEKWMQGVTSKPVIWGTCAGLILLANQLTDKKKGGQMTLGGLDITACRNTYGRQQESFEADLELKDPQLYHKSADEEGKNIYRGIFIRAPGIDSVDKDTVSVLARLNSNGQDRIVAAKQDNIMVTAFHPELTEDTRWHLYFLNMVADKVTKDHINTTDLAAELS